VAAVRAGNAEQAGQITASIRNAITGLRDAGQLRLEVASAILGLLLVLLVVAVAMRIRARRRRTALVAALATASASNLEAQPPLTGGQASDPSDTEMFQATQVGATFGAVEDQAPPVVVPLMTPPDDPNG
jgi:hypothetical protein